MMFKNVLKYRLLILSGIIFVTIFACNSAKESETEVKKRLSTLIQGKIDQADIVLDSSSFPATGKVIDFYRTTNYEPLWVNDTALTKQGLELYGLLTDAQSYGLWPEYYSCYTIQNLMPDSLLDVELLLTHGFYLFTTHLQVGVLERDTVVQFNSFKQNIDFNHHDLLRKIKDGKPVKEVVLNVQPKLWEYEQLQKGLADFVSQYNLDTIHVIIPPIKKDSAKCYEAARSALIKNHFLTMDESKNDSIFLEKLKFFQLKNGLKDDAVVGKWTGRMLEKSNKDRFYKGALSLEKWRWKGRDTLPERYVWVNLPSYTLKFFDQNELVRQHRVVVGAYGTQTPEFHAKMKRMVTNPFWYVPYSIASTEILNGIKKDSTYLERRGYKLFRDGAEVNAKNVNWTEVGETNFRYNVRQNGGGGNSLGKIKFLFPNKHAVYIHDTPSKSLFWNDIRAYSHGCVRLHQPNELARAILNIDNNKVPGDSIASMINRGVKRVIELNNPIDVYIEYYTAAGDSLGQITFYPDMYGRDKKYIEVVKANTR